MTAKHDLRRARYERACWWLARGVDVVPLKPDSKQLQPGYGPRKAHITDMTFAAKWFLNTDANLAIVLGEPAGLAVADWDDRQIYQAWIEATGAVVDTLTEQTSRGYHSFFIAKGLPSIADHRCEFKTNGVCMVSPSRHPSGVIYQIVNNASILTIDIEKMQALFPFLSESFGQQRCNGEQDSPVEQSSKKKRRSLVKNGVVARIKAARSIVAEMSAAGIKLQPAGKTVLVGLCPFHEDHSPSLWVNFESGLWGCNKPTCSAAGTHDVINFRALAREISNSAAIKQMADEFLKPTHR